MERKRHIGEISGKKIVWYRHEDPSRFCKRLPISVIREIKRNQPGDLNTNSLIGMSLSGQQFSFLRFLSEGMPEGLRPAQRGRYPIEWNSLVRKPSVSSTGISSQENSAENKSLTGSEVIL